MGFVKKQHSRCKNLQASRLGNMSIYRNKAETEIKNFKKWIENQWDMEQFYVANTINKVLKEDRG